MTGEGGVRRQLQAADGRRLEVLDGGAAGGPAIVVHSGTPGSCLQAPAWADDAGRRGLRLVSYSRPGYGRSQRLPGRSVAQAAADVALIADGLGLDRFATWGISGGGPHALACAARLPGRVVAAATISGPAPFGAPGLDWLAGMGESNVEEFQLALTGDQAAILAAAEAAARELRAAGPEELLERMASLLSDPDAALVRGPFGIYLAACFAEGLAPGGAGVADDDLAFATNWGFEMDQIRVPVQVWQGGQDLMVPAAHGAWLAEHIPGAEAHLEPGSGHMSVVAERIGEVHEWLARCL